MNKDIIVMLDLQEKWDLILDARENISRREKSIKYWEDELSALKKKELELNKAIKDKQNNIKKLELELAESEGKIKRLEERKTNIHNERELKAVTNELELLNATRDTVEENLIQLMDNLTEDEESQKQLLDELKEKESQVFSDTNRLTEEIKTYSEIISSNNEKFNKMSEDLSAKVKSKFLKLISSKEGKAIAEISGEICGFCNFTIPAFLAVEAAKDDTVSVCTNCGRFIFKKK